MAKVAEDNVQKKNFEYDLNETAVPNANQNRINWNALPVTIKTGWLETQHDRRVAAVALSSFALLSGLCTVGAAIGFTAAPLVVIGVTAGLAFLTVASITSAIVLLCLKQSHNDPQYLLGLRMKLKQELNDNAEWGFENIRNKFLKEIISDVEINTLLTPDLQLLDYPTFIRKHGISVIDVLNVENHKKLRDKCLDHFKQNLSFKQIAQQPEVAKFGLNQIEWVFDVAYNEANNIISSKGTYHQFVERNGSQAISYISKDHPAYGYFRESFEKSVLEENLGVIEFDRLYSRDQEKLSSNLRDQIIDADLKKLQAGSLTYENFYNRNGLEVIKKITQNEDHQKIFRFAYLNLPFKTQNCLKHHEFLKITQADISQFLLQRWDKMPISQIVQDSDFKNSVGVTIPAETFSLKALEETRSIPIIEIARQMPILFSKGIIKHDEISRNFCIAERMSTELSALKSIDELINTPLKSIDELINIPSVLFEYNIIDRSHFAITRLVGAFVQSNSASYLDNNWTGNDLLIKEWIDNYQLMPNPIANELKLAQTNYNAHEIAYRKNIKECNETYASNLSNQENYRDQQKSAAATQLGISNLEMELKEFEIKLQQASTRLDEAVKLQSDIKSKKTTYSNRISKINEQTRNLITQIRNLKLSYPKRNLEIFQDSLNAKNNQIDQIRMDLNRNSELRKLDANIERLERRATELIRSSDPIATQLNSLEGAYKEFENKMNRFKMLELEISNPNFSIQIVELKNRIQNAENARKNPTGLKDAFKALGKDIALEKDKKSLANLETKKAEFERLKINFRPEEERIERLNQITQLKNKLDQLTFEIAMNKKELLICKNQKNNLMVSCGSQQLVQLEAEKKGLEGNVKTYANKFSELKGLKKHLNKKNIKLEKYQKELMQVNKKNDETNEMVGKFSAEKQITNNYLQVLTAKLNHTKTLLANKKIEIDNQFIFHKNNLDQQRNFQLNQIIETYRCNLTNIKINFNKVLSQI